MPFKPASDALKGLVVLDLTRARAGPTCARQFADWGADVIKVEAPASMYTDFAMRHSPDFQNLHRNKRSLTLDFKKPEGMEIFRKLVEKADVIVENFRPDVKHRLGIDYESMKKVNPRIVYGSISGFGQTGPYAKRPGLDPIIQGMGGHMSVTGKPGGGPIRSGAAISDVTAGLLCANAILIALLERERTGEGQWVDTSLLEAMIFLLDFQAARVTMSGDVPKQVGNDHPTSVPTSAYKTSDGYVIISGMANKWPALCEALGDPDMATRAGFESLEERRKHRDEVNAAIEELTQKATMAEWIEKLNDIGIPCGPIYTLDQTFADPQVQHTGIAQSVHSNALGDITLIGQPVHMSRSKTRLVTAPPEAGEHNDEILSDLGYTPEQIDSFRAAEVL